MRNLIAGQWVSAPDGATFPVTDPATGEVIDHVPDGDAAHMAQAVDAAAAALDSWRRTTAPDRAAVLRRMVELGNARTEALAATICRESGKPRSEGLGEVRYALGFLEQAAIEGPRVTGDILASSRADQRIHVLRQPVGVTVAITPWNFPLAMVTRKVGAALAVGCTQVVKPAPETPLSALALAELAVEAGLPPGVLNVVTGDPVAFSDVALGDQRVRKLSFTGSTSVGRELIRKSATNVTRLSLELGGHAPVIVLDDADLAVAVTMTIDAKFRNAGQSCVAANRVFVAAARYEAFVEELQRQMSALTIGRWDQDCSVGPLINEAAVAKVERLVADATERGARLVMGGSRVSPGPGLTDRFFEPTLLAEVDDSMAVCVEETFGPVVSVEPYSDLDAALATANRSPYGLAAYVAGRDLGALLRVAEALECGVVGVNDGLPSTPQAPFGGWKASGLGREGGRYVMGEYLETKYVSLVV